MAEEGAEILEYIGSLTGPMSLDEMRDAVTHLRDHLRVKHLSICVVVDPKGCSIADRVITTYDPGWVQRYVANRYWMFDPVLAGFYEGLTRLSWRGDQTQSEGVPPFVKSFVEDAKRYGAGSNGLARYVRLGSRGSYVLTITSDEDPDLFFARLRHQEDNLQMAAHQLSIAMFASTNKNMAKFETLLEDEMLVLRLLASGCDHYQMSVRLALPRSVESIVKAIKRKLNVASITEAIYQFGSLRADEFLPPADFEIKSVHGDVSFAKTAGERS